MWQLIKSFWRPFIYYVYLGDEDLVECKKMVRAYQLLPHHLDLFKICKHPLKIWLYVPSLESVFSWEAIIGIYSLWFYLKLYFFKAMLLLHFYLLKISPIFWARLQMQSFSMIFYLCLHLNQYLNLHHILLFFFFIIFHFYHYLPAQNL